MTPPCAASPATTIPASTPRSSRPSRPRTAAIRSRTARTRTPRVCRRSSPLVAEVRGEDLLQTRGTVLSVGDLMPRRSPPRNGREDLGVDAVSDAKPRTARRVLTRIQPSSRPVGQRPAEGSRQARAHLVHVGGRRYPRRMAVTPHRRRSTVPRAPSPKAGVGSSCTSSSTPQQPTSRRATCGSR